MKLVVEPQHTSRYGIGTSDAEYIDEVYWCKKTLLSITYQRINLDLEAEHKSMRNVPC